MDHFLGIDADPSGEDQTLGKRPGVGQPALDQEKIQADFLPFGQGASLLYRNIRALKRPALEDRLRNGNPLGYFHRPDG